MWHTVGVNIEIGIIWGNTWIRRLRTHIVDGSKRINLKEIGAKGTFQVSARPRQYNP